VDEVQKVERWSETVKHLWDEDTRERRTLRNAAPAALVMERDARLIRRQPRGVPLLRWLPWRGPVGG
jgi:predicted AAA+ superfamily ATPase